MPRLHRLMRLLPLCSVLVLYALVSQAQVEVSEPTLSIGTMGGSGWRILSPEMKRQLRDPDQRKALRAAERARIETGQPSLARVLRLTPPRAEELLQLLTDQAMTELDRSLDPDPERNSTEANIRVQRDNLQAVRRLLGEAGFQEYRDFLDASTQRLQVLAFTKQLAAADALSFEQQEQLVQVLIAERDQERERDWLSVEAIELPQSAARLEQANMPRLQVLALEAQLRHTERFDSAVLARLPALLNARQLAAFAELQSQQIAALRSQALQARDQAGIGTTPVQYPPVPPPLTGPMRLNVQFEINGERTPRLALEVAHGKPVSFDAPGGLVGEAIGFFFEGEYMVAHFRFFERTPTGRRLTFEFPGWMFTGCEQATVMKWGSSSSMTSSGLTPFTASVNYSAVRL